MMKTVSVCLLVIAAFASVEAVEKCRTKDGKKVVTFGGTVEPVRFPCKYNAIRNTTCGNWRVTVSPGNILEPNRNKLYVIKTMFVSAKRLSDGKYWQGRSDLKIARKYLTGLHPYPFNTKGGDLSIDDVFTFSDANDQVSLIEKGGAFKVSFGLFTPQGLWHKSSTFTFECYSDDFVPEPYPEQLCGNGTSQEVKKWKKARKWRENRQATLFYNVFSDAALVQTDENCILAQTALSANCVYNGQDLGYTAAKLCWPLVGQPRYQRCISGNMDIPIRAFRHCLEFVCSGYTDSKACEDLGSELDFCPKLKEVSDEVKNRCMPNLVNP